MRAKDKKYFIRLEMAKFARTHGVRPAMVRFACARNTVRLWVKRFKEGGPSNLHDRSRAPKSCPHKTSPQEERKVLEARRQIPPFGPRRLRDLCGCKPSLGAIARILRENGLTKKPRRKHQRKNDLRAIKAQYRAFERLQADTKPLYDIPAYWPQMQALGLPRHQYTIRDVKSGALFVDYADELSTTYAIMATEKILERLGRAGVDLSRSVLSTDNGSEYGGGERRERQIGFHARMGAAGVVHRFLPPATPNAHGDVESSHGAIQKEFFDLEPFRSRCDLFEKTATYQAWWNFVRPNYSKGKKTPAQILQEEGLDPIILLAPPTDLDAMLRRQPDTLQVGQHLPVLPESSARRRVSRAKRAVSRRAHGAVDLRDRNSRPRRLPHCAC